MKRIMVVSPHPDDETLGAGGTLLKKRSEKSVEGIFWLNITNMTEEYHYSKEEIDNRNLEIETVRKRYRFDDFCNLNLEPAGLSKYDFVDVNGKIRDFIEKTLPDTLILPYEFDAHSDHAEVFHWMYPFTKSFRYPFIKKVLLMEILSETEFTRKEMAFKPNFFVDISEYMDEKIDIMRLYQGEMKDPPFPRSAENIKALATLRGAMGGVRYAEGFRIIKWID